MNAARISTLISNKYANVFASITFPNFGNLSKLNSNLNDI